MLDELTITRLLLYDHTTNRPIFDAQGEITPERALTIQPRYKKRLADQKQRSKDKAEVFTPTWVVNAQNNLVDNAWFGRENVFNTEKDKEWVVTDKVIFDKGHSWQDYVTKNVMEITCGEAPYLVSRYNAETGEPIPIPQRVGLLDRKIRVVCENTDNLFDWYFWIVQAYKSTYGFEYQGDNLFLARKNLLDTFLEIELLRCGKSNEAFLSAIIGIITCNVIQMDGLKCTIPDTCAPDCKGCKKNGDIHQHDGIYAKIYDWDRHEFIRYIDLL